VLGSTYVFLTPLLDGPHTSKCGGSTPPRAGDSIPLAGRGSDAPSWFIP